MNTHSNEDPLRELDELVDDDGQPLPPRDHNEPERTDLSKVVTTFDRDEMQIGQFRITPTGLKMKGKPDFERCSDFGSGLALLNKANQFAAGDFVNYVESEFGERAAQIIDSDQWSESTVKVYSWVAGRVPMANRRAELTFSHHQVVAELPSDEQRTWLDRAVKGDGNGEVDDLSGVWTVARLKKEIKAQKEGGVTEEVFIVKVEVGSEEKQQELLRQLTNLGYSHAKPSTATKVVKDTE